MKYARSIIALTIVAIALLAFGQVRESVTVNVVEVPVSVVDSSGNPVRGLTAANFELYDNGTKRDINAFDKIDFASSESLSAISPLNPNARRQFMLLFDLGYASPSALARAQEAARKFIKENVQPRDLVAVGTIEPQRGFRLLTAFTTDRPLIEAAMADPGQFRGNDPLQITNNTEAFKPSEGNSSDPTTGRGATGNAAAAAEEERETAGRLQKVNEQLVRAKIDRQIDALGQLAKTLRAVPGRKQIILLSEGFDPKYIEGRDVRAGQEAFGENEQVLRGQSYNVDSDARFGNTTSINTLDRMAQYFKQSDVVLNAIDIQGVRVQNTVQEGATINSNDGLFLLSRPTGGELFKNANDVTTNFQRMLKSQEVVYVLGFNAPTQKPGAFHNLKVKLVNVPGSAKVSYRAGYYETGGESAQERQLSNAEIIVNDIPQSDVHLNAFAAAFPDGSGNAQVPVILDVNGTDLAKDFHGSSLPVEIYIYAFDQDGIVRDRLYQKIGIDLKKLSDRLKIGGLKYYGTLVLPPGTYAVKSLVRAGETDRRGFGRADIVVPKPNVMTVMAPVPMDEQRNGVLVKGASHANASAPIPFQLNGDQFIPSAAAKKNGGPQKIVVYVYGANANELTWETTPKTKYLGDAKGLGVTALVLEVDPKDANVASVDVTVRKKGAAESQKTSVPIVQ